MDAWLDGLLPAAMEREGIAGAVVSVVHDGKVVTERGYGWADTGVSGSAPARVDASSTLFRIGSISKLVTATSVMQLLEEGRLDLDQPIETYLDFDLPVRYSQPITLRHLLSHTAGFEDQIAEVIGDPDAAAPALRKVVSVDPPEQIYQPGTVPSYSNYSNALAAYIVQRVSGQTYADYVEEHIFSPADMRSATLAQPLSSVESQHMSKGYDSATSPEVPFEMVGPAPAGAISATAPDMSAFMLAQLGHPTSSGQLLQPKTLALMQRPALDEDSLGGLAAGPRMTLGFFQQDRHGHRILEHAGDLTAFHTDLNLYPDDDTGIFIALNSTGTRSDSTTIIRDLLMDGFANRYFPNATADPAAQATPSDHADALAGAYVISRRSESTFARLFFLLSKIDVTAGPDGTIAISAITDASGAPARFAEVEPWVWQEVGGQRRIAVDQKDGTPRAVGLNPAFTLLPMPTYQALLLPVAAASALIIVLGLLMGPIGAAVRWRHRVALTPPFTKRKFRWLLRLAQLTFVAAAACWAVIADALLNDAPPPTALLFRAAQTLTLLAVLGAVPAACLLGQTIRRPANFSDARSWPTIGALALSVAAFLAIAYVAYVGGLLEPSITY